MTSQVKLTDLPEELLLDHLLPSLPTRDLLVLGSTNRILASLTSDEVFWKRKCEEDFNFSGSRTARRTGWKAIYKGLSNPKVFVWGSTGNGRLGFPQDRLRHAVTRGGMPYPVHVRIPGARIVDLISGGWCFYALDSEGSLYVWGTLDGTSYALYRDGFSEESKIADTPHLLRLPEKVKSVSCGRKHALALDTKGGVWTFLSWGRPYLAITPLLDHTSPETTAIQVECGWSFCAVLTQSGDVLVWWPFDGDRAWYDDKMKEMDEQGDDTKAKAIEEGAINVIPCSVWQHEFTPRRLPPIPVRMLPDLSHHVEEAQGDSNWTGIKLVKVAAMEGGLVGLTNKGHVLFFRAMGMEVGFSSGSWEYLPMFSETQKVAEHGIYRQGEGNGLAPPAHVHITHISANYRTFSAYSVDGFSSVVLMGSDMTRPSDMPTILPELQNQSVISVVLGDYHKAALTADGKLLTWGAYSQGALGLGDPGKLTSGSPGAFNEPGGRRVPDVFVPTEVKFGRDGKLRERRERFVFGVTAAGWHTGALVYDLDGTDDDDKDDLPPPESENLSDDDFHRDLPHPLPQIPFNPHGPGGMPIVPLPFRGGGHAIPFVRVGFAGRGAARGGRARGGGPGGGRGAQE